MRPAFPPARNDKIRTSRVGLEIENAGEDDSGWFVCIACNYYGPCVASEAYLDVIPAEEDAGEVKEEKEKEKVTIPQDDEPRTRTPTEEDAITSSRYEVNTITPTRDTRFQTPG